MQEDFDDGFVLIDPDGTLAEALADRIPVEFTERTAYLDPGDLAHPFGLNVLDVVAPDDRHKVAKEFCAFFDTIFPAGPTTLTHERSNYLLLNCLCLIMAGPHPNLLCIPKLLADHAYRTACLGHCTDPIVLEFWLHEFPAWKPEDALPLKAKIGELVTSPLVRNILAQPHSTFSLGGGHIVIANLDRTRIGNQTAFLLGSLLLARSRGPVYVNNLGFFATDQLASFFSQGRFTVSLQYLDELPRKLRQEVLAFDDVRAERVNMEDAEVLSFKLGVMNPRTLMENDPIDAPQLPVSLDRLKAVRKRSRASHTRPRLAVEEQIRQFLEGTKKPGRNRWEG